MKLQDYTHRPLSEKAADELIQYILEKNLEPGDRLPTEPELSAMLRVGRGTLREAVRSLVSRNVLTVRQGAGTFVAERVGISDDPLGLAFIRDKYKLAVDILQVRLMIEPEVAAIAAMRATDGELLELERLCLQVESHINQQKNHAKADQEFHIKIATCSRNDVIVNLFPMIHPSIELFVDLTRRDLLTETVETHREILTALRCRDSLRARDAMRMHLMHNKQSLEKHNI